MTNTYTKQNLLDVFAKLKAKYPTLTAIIYGFNGGGDEGYIENPMYEFTDNEVHEVNEDDNDLTKHGLSALITEDVGDWYNNEGGNGQLDITENSVIVSANINHMTSTHYEINL